MSKYNKFYASIAMGILFVAGSYFGIMPEGFGVLTMVVLQGALTSLSVLAGPSNK